MNKPPARPAIVHVVDTASLEKLNLIEKHMHSLNGTALSISSTLGLLLGIGIVGVLALVSLVVLSFRN